MHVHAISTELSSQVNSFYCQPNERVRIEINNALT